MALSLGVMCYLLAVLACLHSGAGQPLISIVRLRR